MDAFTASPRAGAEAGRPAPPIDRALVCGAAAGASRRAPAARRLVEEVAMVRVKERDWDAMEKAIVWRESGY